MNPTPTKAGSIVAKATLLTLGLLITCTPTTKADGIRCLFRDINGSYDTLGNWRDIETVGTLAYAAVNTDGLQIYDVSNPDAPIRLGTYNTPDRAFDVEIVDTTAYVADGEGGLQIIDISDPNAPTLIGSYNTNTIVTTVAVQGNTVFLGDSTTDNQSVGVHIIDISNPASPTPIGTINQSSVSSLTIDGSTLYITGFYTGIRTVDITNPATPILQGNYNPTKSYRSVTIDGTIAYITSTSQGFEILDISDPQNLTLIGSYTSPEYLSNTIYGVEVVGNTVYATVSGGFDVIDISNPSAPAYINGHLANGVVNGLSVVNGKVFLANSSQGLQIFDVTDVPNSPYLGNFETPDDYIYEAAFEGTTAYLAYLDGLQIVDLSNPSSPVPLSSYHADEIGDSGNIGLVTVENNIAYMGFGSGIGLRILDVSDPSSPTLLGSSELSVWLTAISKSGNTLYSTDGNSGIRIHDVTNPAAPTLLGSYLTPRYALDVQTEGNKTYVLDDRNLHVLDTSDPSAPTLLGSIQTMNAKEVEVVGTTAFVVANNFIHIIDVSNPTTPTLLSSVQTPANTNGTGGISVVDSIAYHTLNPNSVFAMDVSDPANPETIGVFRNRSGASDVHVLGDTVYMYGATFGITMVDFSDCPPNCPADFNNDEAYNFLDISAFLSAFSTTDPTADFNQDGSYNFLDISEFLNTFAAGCP